MNPAYQTIVLRLGYDDATEDQPVDWHWRRLLIDASDSFQVSDAVHLLTVRFEDEHDPILSLPFSSVDLAVDYLTEWMIRRHHQEKDTDEPGCPPDRFDDFVSAAEFARHRFFLCVSLTRLTIDPVFGED